MGIILSPQEKWYRYKDLHFVVYSILTYFLFSLGLDNLNIGPSHSSFLKIKALKNTNTLF